MSPQSAAGTKPLTSSVFYILLALSDGDRHGLGIADEVARRTGGDVRLGPGTLYNAIKKMLDSGLIEESSWRPEPEEDDARRRYYRISAAGRTSVVAEAERLEQIVAVARDKDLLGSARGL